MNKLAVSLFVAALSLLPWGARAQEPEPASNDRLTIEKLDDRQVAALVLTGKVWGFLKYHHPAVTAGQRQWDEELLTRLPDILAARSSRAVQVELVKWIDTLGPVENCRVCADARADQADVNLRPRLAWISDTRFLGAALSQSLQRIHRNRVAGQQHYVQLQPGVGNAVFINESSYPEAALPDNRLRILGVLRFWNAVEYWYPYRDLIDGDWDAVLAATLRRVAPPLESLAWHRELYRLTARIRDGHAGIVGKISPRGPFGPCRLPISLRVVDRQFIVETVLSGDEMAHRFQPGDLLQSLDGKPVADIVTEVRDLYGASNEPFQLFAIGRILTRGDCGAAMAGVWRGGPLTLPVQRVPSNSVRMLPVFFNDREGETLQVLADDVLYLKLSTLKDAELPEILDRLARAKSLVIDIRNYPAAFVVFKLGQALVDEPTPFVTFTEPDLSNPGLFGFGRPLSLEPASPHISARVAVLVDESTLSSAEYTALALSESPRVRVYGRQTAGADGNVSLVPLPGDLAASMSGIGVFRADRRPTQQIGVIPDVHCPVTIVGLREGRDEILECALQGLAGPLTSPAGP